MKVSVEKPGTPGELVHHGVKGMRWGHRKAESSGGGGGGGSAKGPGKLKRAARALGRFADDVQFEAAKGASGTTQKIVNDASDKLRKDLPGIKAKHGDYGKMKNRAKRPFSKEAKAYRADVKAAYLRHLESSANAMTNIRGTRRYTLTSEKGKPNTSKYFWEIRTEAVTHGADEGTFTVRPIFDEEGYIIDFELVDGGDMAQSAIDDILDRDGELKLANL